MQRLPTSLTRGARLLALACLFTPVPSALLAQDARRAVDPAEPATEAVERAVRSAHAELKRAAESLDVNALYAGVLDSDTPPIIEDGRLATSRAAARAATTKGFQGVNALSYAYSHEHVTVLSPTTALWVADGTASAELADGRRIEAPFAETLLFVLRDGEWRVLHGHRSAP